MSSTSLGWIVNLKLRLLTLYMQIHQPEVYLLEYHYQFHQTIHYLHLHLKEYCHHLSSIQNTITSSTIYFIISILPRHSKSSSPLPNNMSSFTIPIIISSSPLLYALLSPARRGIISPWIYHIYTYIVKCHSYY
jgi:hypothetical protein